LRNWRAIQCGVVRGGNNDSLVETILESGSLPHLSRHALGDLPRRSTCARNRRRISGAELQANGENCKRGESSRLCMLVSSQSSGRLPEAVRQGHASADRAWRSIPLLPSDMPGTRAPSAAGVWSACTPIFSSTQRTPHSDDRKEMNPRRCLTRRGVLVP
jgi:hypothetical protein